MSKPSAAATPYPEVKCGAPGPPLRSAGLLPNGFYRCYAVLTMCRMLYTIHHGTIVSKRVAAGWAREALDPRWTRLIDDALAWSQQLSPDLSETLAYIGFACDDAGHPESRE